MQGAGEAPISWEQHLYPGSLNLENLEVLTEVSTLGIRAAKKNRCGAAKKWARKDKMAEALDGDSIGSQPWLPQGGQKQALQELGTSGTQGKEKEKMKSGTGQGGPTSSEGKGPS